MADIVQFQKRERGDLLWICACGCSTHRHYSDGRVECASCGNVGSVSNDGWRQLLPPTPSTPVEVVPDGSFAVYPIDTAETFMKRRMKDADGIDAVVILHAGGQASTWALGDATTDLDALSLRLSEAAVRMCRRADKAS